MNIKIKLGPDAVCPIYKTDGAAAMDLTSTSVISTKMYIEYGTQVYLEIPKGYVGLLFPRSSVSDTCLILANSVGVIDSDYRGEVRLRFKQTVPYTGPYKTGERVGQIMFIPLEQATLEIVEELEESIRGEGGFGSTNKQ